MTFGWVDTVNLEGILVVHWSKEFRHSCFQLLGQSAIALFLYLSLSLSVSLSLSLSLCLVHSALFTPLLRSSHAIADKLGEHRRVFYCSCATLLADPGLCGSCLLRKGYPFVLTAH